MATVSELNRRHTIENNLRLSLYSARAAYDASLVKLMRLNPTDSRWTEQLQEVQLAREVVVEYESNLAKGLARQAAELEAAQAQEPQPEPKETEPKLTQVSGSPKVEPASEPELKVKSIAQEKAEANARVALANKGKSAAHKAESLDVPVATVRKVEKAKAAAKVQVTATDKPMDTAAMKKLAKELGVSYEGIKFTSSKARADFRATLEQAQAKHEAKVWEGLSPSRQAKLSKMQSVDSNRASARAIAI